MLIYLFCKIIVAATKIKKTFQTQGKSFLICFSKILYIQSGYFYFYSSLVWCYWEEFIQGGREWIEGVFGVYLWRPWPWPPRSRRRWGHDRQQKRHRRRQHPSSQPWGSETASSGRRGRWWSRPGHGVRPRRRRRSLPPRCARWWCPRPSGFRRRQLRADWGILARKLIWPAKFAWELSRCGGDRVENTRWFNAWVTAISGIENKL